MKALIALITIITISATAGCNKRSDASRTKSTQVVVIDDLTDSLAVHPLADPILALYDLGKNKDQAADFNYVLLTNKLLNPVKNIRLGSAKATEAMNTQDDPRNRDKLISKFHSAVRAVFAEFPERFRNQESQDGSRCFCTVISQVRKLAESNYDKKVLLVFSDLLENSSVLNLYDPRARAELQQDPESVGKRLSQQCPIPKKLENISITFIYQPRTKQEDERFLEIAGAYQTLLGNRGAQIHIQASNDKFPLSDELQ